MKFSVHRKHDAGVVDGGFVITDDFAIQVELKVAGIRLQLGEEVCWMSRDEAHEVAAAILAAASDG